jgi:hypothetical protein
MVLWSFFGVRKRSGLDADLKTAQPLQLIFVAIVLALAFIGILLTVARSAIHALT